MRHLIVSFCFLLAVLSVQAAQINGILIESSGGNIIVFIDGQRVSSPTLSCFVANLSHGHYRIEVYASSSRHGEQPARGKLLYSERVYFSGKGIKDIVVESGGRNRPDETSPQRGDALMKSKNFDEFFNLLKSQSFASERMTLIDNALITSNFTCEQCKKIIGLYSFDSERLPLMEKMYPKIVDKQNFFKVIGLLDFQSSKNRMNEFVKKYHQ